MGTSNRGLWLIFGLLGLIWGSSYLFIKIGVESLGPFTLVSLRLLFAGSFLAIVVRISREPLPRDPQTLRQLAVLGLLSIFIPFSLITWGELHVTSGLAAVLNATVPFFTILVAALVLHDEPLRLNRVLGLAIGFVGVAVVASPTLPGGVIESDLGLAGVIAVTLSSVAYAAGAVYARRYLQHLRPMTIALGMVSFGFLVSAPLALVLERPFANGLRPEALVSVAWLGVLGSGVAMLIFYRLLASWGATRTNSVPYLIPPVGVILGVVVLHEPLDLSIVAGTALIIAGLALVNARQGLRRLLRRPAAPLPEA